MHTTINLIPNSKQEKLKASRLRRIVLTSALGVMAVAVGVPILMLTIKGAQNLSLNRAQTQIDERKNQILQTPNIITMLTTKDHLESLPNLYAQRIYPSRLLDILPKVIPKSIRLTDLSISAGGTLTFKGVASTYNEVERFNKSLLTHGLEYNPDRIEQDPNTNGTFTQVNVAEVSGPAGSEVAFTITANFNPILVAGDNQ